MYTVKSAAQNKREPRTGRFPIVPAPVSVVRDGDPLLLGIVGLGDGGIELVAAGSVVALKFIVDLRGSAQCLFQIDRPGSAERDGRFCTSPGFPGGCQHIGFERYPFPGGPVPGRTRDTGRPPWPAAWWPG